MPKERPQNHVRCFGFLPIPAWAGETNQLRGSRSWLGEEKTQLYLGKELQVTVVTWCGNCDMWYLVGSCNSVLSHPNELLAKKEIPDTCDPVATTVMAKTSNLWPLWLCGCALQLPGQQTWNTHTAPGVKPEPITSSAQWCASSEASMDAGSWQGISWLV